MPLPPAAPCARGQPQLAPRGTSSPRPRRPAPCPPPAQIMDLLGPSLWDVWNKEGQVLTAQFVACVAVEALVILEALHTKG